MFAASTVFTGPPGETLMSNRQNRIHLLARSCLLAIALSSAAAVTPAASAEAVVPEAVAKGEGLLRLRSTHSFGKTVMRLKTSVTSKGIRLFDDIDQQQLAKDANLTLGRSTIVRFGNPPLGVQFLQANPYAGIDWPVRMLVVQEPDGSVWLAWTDFAYLAKRYGITTLDAQFKMATEVSRSIAADAAN